MGTIAEGKPSAYDQACRQALDWVSDLERGVKPAGETVEDVSYDGQGCSISQAATSVLTDQVIGQSVGDAMKTVAAFTEMISSRGNVEGDEDVIGDGIAFAGVAKYPARVKCALLGWTAFKAALAEASDDVEDKR